MASLRRPSTIGPGRVRRMQAASAVLAATIAVAGLPAAPSHAATADAAFTIANYPVDSIDKDAVRAKEKALADGQQAAFRSLLRRLVPVTAYRRLAKLQAKAGEMIDGVAVRSERNSSTEYIANLDFSFQPQAVRNFLKREGLPFVDTQAPEVVVIPVLRNAQGAATAAGPWADAWKGLDLSHALAPVKIDALREAIHPDTIKMALEGSGEAERILSGEYHADRVVLAIADVDTATRRLNVVFSGRDAVGPLFLKRSWRLNGDEAYALEFAAVVGLGVLEGRWKATQTLANAAASPPWSAPGAATTAGAWGGGMGGTVGGAPGAGMSGFAGGQLVQIEAQFASQAQWNDMRGRLLDTPGVDGVEIGAMTARSASITLRFPGGGDRLAQALSAQGLDLHSIGQSWSLRSAY